MRRKRGAAATTALIASLAVMASVVGSAGASTTPPSEPAGTEAAGDGPACPEPEAVETTEAAETTAAPETTAAAAAETTAAPETTEAAAVETEPAATLPENVSELDPGSRSTSTSSPRESLQQGGSIRLAVSSLAENWNPFTPDGNERDFADLTEPMTYFPFPSTARVSRPRTPTTSPRSP